MMCYRDRTYCEGPCGFAECSRQITPAIEADARKRDLPLAISDFRPNCASYVPPHSPSPREGTP